MQMNKLINFVQDVALGVFCNLLSKYLEMLPMINFMFFMVFVSIMVITPTNFYIFTQLKLF